MVRQGLGRTAHGLGAMAADERLRVVVKTHHHDKFEVHMQHDDSLADLKRKIHDTRRDFPVPAEQKLISAGKVLHDRFRLGDIRGALATGEVTVMLIVKRAPPGRLAGWKYALGEACESALSFFSSAWTALQHGDIMGALAATWATIKLFFHTLFVPPSKSRHGGAAGAAGGRPRPYDDG